MRALQFYGAKDLRVVDVAEPDVRPGHVKVAVSACGICGSDVHEYVGGPVGRPFDEPHPRTGVFGPVTMGHEAVGTIVEIGEGVERLAVGQRVVTEALRGCGTCPPCREGLQNLCQTLDILGATSDGAMAPYVVVPEAWTHAVPEHLSDEKAVLTEPLAVALRSIARGDVRAGDDVVVFGAGPIGLMTILALRVAGARQVIVCEPSRRRAGLATRAGADVVLDPTEVDVVATILELTAGRGADVALDTAGVDASFAAAYSCIRKQGTVVSVAAWEHPTEFHPLVLLFTEATITGTLGYGPRDFPFALELLADPGLDLDWMITATVSLEEAVSGGFEQLVHHREDHVKILVRP